jgi:hypothetical protein
VFAALKAHGHPVERMLKDEKHGSANPEKSPRLLQEITIGRGWIAIVEYLGRALAIFSSGPRALSCE